MHDRGYIAQLHIGGPEMYCHQENEGITQKTDTEPIKRAMFQKQPGSVFLLRSGKVFVFH